MAYWLLKSEPSTYSWQNLQKDKRTSWSGVRNFQARNNLQAMKKGEQAFFYHSGDGKEVVGVSTVVKEAYLDPTDKTNAFVCVDLKAVEPLKARATVAARPRVVEPLSIRSRPSTVVESVSSPGWAVSSGSTTSR